MHSPKPPPVCYAIDDVALASLRQSQKDESLQCGVCGEPIAGVPAGSGLFMWTRGAETRFDEPPLCGRCATAIGVAALAGWGIDEEG